MGLDIGIKIKMLDEFNVPQIEIEVSEQDNSLGSILEGSSEIRYLSVNLNDKEFLNQEELEKVKLNYDPEQEMVMTSNILDSKEAVRIFDKIFRFTYRRLSNSLEKDIEKINSLEIDEENKSSRRKSQISEYLEFEYSLGVTIGILKSAAKIYPKVQIIGEYY